MGAGCKPGGLGCTLCLLTSAFVASCMVVYLASVFFKFIPIWQPVLCGPLPEMPETRSMSASWINVSMSQGKSCENPNPFPLYVTANKDGEVFMNSTNGLVPIGWSEHPDSAFPSQGAGEQVAILKSELPMLQAQAVWFVPEVQVVTKVYLRTSLVITLYGMEREAGKDVETYCAFTYSPLTGNKSDSKCSSTLDELVIPPLDFKDPVDEPAKIDISEDSQDQLKRARNLMVGAPMILCFIIAVSCLSGGIYSMCRRRALVKAKAGGGEAGGVGAVGVQEGQKARLEEGCPDDASCN